jgi:excinuclease ABC subunit B
VTPADALVRAIDAIKVELRERLQELGAEMKLVEKQRLEQRTMFDLEMLEQMGHCNGIENYSRHLAGRKAGDPPTVLIDYFPKDYLLFVDESHQTVPQVGAMYRGDRARDARRVRLPAAQRSTTGRSWRSGAAARQAISSRRRRELELKNAGVVVEQILRPTGSSTRSRGAAGQGPGRRPARGSRAGQGAERCWSPR